MAHDSSFFESEMELIRQRVELLSNDAFIIDGNKLSIPSQRPYLEKRVTNVSCWIYELEHVKANSSLYQHHLSHQLYLRIFCGLNEAQMNAALPLLSERRQYMDALSQANTSKNTPDLRWLVIPSEADEVGMATKNRISRLLIPGSYMPSVSDPHIVNFHRVAESRQREQQYYYAYSDTYFPENLECICLYWNLNSDGALKLLKVLTTSLNQFKIPFQFKCLNHPQLFVQLNNAVLHISKQDLPLVRKLIELQMEGLQKHLNDKVPPFTTAIFPGVGLAEDLDTRGDYGRYIMRLIAGKLIEEFNCSNPFLPVQHHDQSQPNIPT